MAPFPGQAGIRKIKQSGF